MQTQTLLSNWAARLFSAAALALVPSAHADNSAARYHFAGAADLSRKPNYSVATNLFGLPTSRDFKGLALDRFAGFLAEGLPSQGTAPEDSIAPLLDDWLSAESVGAFGGTAGGPLQFVLALRLDNARAKAWDDAIAAACGHHGEGVAASGAKGLRWGKGAKALWILHHGNWTLLGRGADLDSVRDEYLAGIGGSGRPVAAMDSNCLEADVDWERLHQWLPISFGALKLARTQIELAAGTNRIFHMTAKATYPQAISWQSQPWKIPYNLVSDPLISFTAMQDISAFLNEDVFAGLPVDPFTQQFYCWAMGEMVFQSYAALPVADATNAMRELGATMPAMLNPKLTNLNASVLHWYPTRNQLSWTSPRLQVVAPDMKPARSQGQPFLLASMFPLQGKTNAPKELFAQFKDRSDIVYYDWEVTGPRLQQWRLLGEMLPVVPTVTGDNKPKEQFYAISATNAAGVKRRVPSFVVSDNWLAGIAPYLGEFTTTEVDKTGPNELTIKRRSPFLLTAVEWDLLTHWMARVPSVGRINPRLLPPAAKMTGPGIPSH